MKILNMLKVLLELWVVYFRVILFKMGFVVKPYKVCWLVTWRCNLACNYCELGQANKQELKDKELSLGEIKRIAPELKKMGTKFITFAGGEPLMYDDIFKAVRYCKDLGFVVGLVTNANLINEDKARELALSGVDHIQISLDFPGELQNKIRNNPNCFQRVDAGIQFLKKYKYISDYHIGIVAVVSGMNYDKLDEVFNYAKKNTLDSVGLQPFFINQIRNQEMAGELTIPKDKLGCLAADISRFMKTYPGWIRMSSFFSRNIPRYFLDPKMKGTSCFGGGLTTNIFPDGTIGSCYYLKAEGAGSLREKSLNEIIHSKEYKVLLQRVRKRDCPTCWCAVVHEYNIFFRPLEMLRSLRLLRVAQDGR